jgi:outer membrane protein assembly factor BamB
LLALFWAIYAVWRWTEVGLSLGFMGWLILLGVGALTTLLFITWWLVASRIGWAECLLVFGTAIATGVAAALLSDQSVGPWMVMPGLPLIMTVWTLALAGMRKLSPSWRGRGLMALVGLSWAAFLLLRTEGLGGDFQLALRWRWSPTEEDVYLAELQQHGEPVPTSVSSAALSLRPGDWPGFRGPNRDGTAQGVHLGTDWNAAPPKWLWKRRIGPAWSSVVIVGDCLFTQEQVGAWETVVCLDAGTGKTLWSHKDAARHMDNQALAGPRATPTFAEGRLYALGATGILNCLDPATGQARWTRNIATDAGVKVPMWGFSSSPLVVGNLVVVFAGGADEDDKSLLAYRVDTGKPAWSAVAGRVSYSSPQLASIGGESQLLFVSDRGLSAFDPVTGALLWEHRTPAGPPGVPRSVQPRVVGSNAILFDAGADVGTALVEVAKKDWTWTATRRWTSGRLKPSFNDFVVHDNAVYGIDGLVLTCIDLQTGKRRWRDGSYGSGQLLLLGDQALLVVVTDEGEAVQVAANPNEHQELGRFKAIKGKTWNHPVIAHGRLYLRNAEEIACYPCK